MVASHLCLAVTGGAEMRAFWVDAFHPGFKSPGEVDAMFARVERAHVNALFVQMRARAASYHVSVFDPPAPDKQPGFDALAYILAQGRERGVAVHVWMNAHPLWPISSQPPPGHVADTHSEWLTKDRQGSTATEVGRALDYGNPEAADYLWRSYAEMVRKYGPDGVHMDFIRYTGPEWGYNAESLGRYKRRTGNSGEPQPLDEAWLAWRRDQVSAVVRKIYATCAYLNWETAVSAALIPWGGPPSAGKTWEETAPMRRALQDWRSWMQEGILDIGMPMLYANETKLPNYLDNWLAWIGEQRHSRGFAAGLGCYLNPQDATMRQISRALAALPLGFCLFSYASTSDSGTGINEYEEAFYERLAGLGPTPAMPRLPWKTQPTIGMVFGTVLKDDLQWADGVEVVLRGPVERRMLTDGTGFYAFVGVPPGSYQLSAGNSAMVRGVRVHRGAATPAHALIDPENLVRRIAGLVEGEHATLSGMRIAATDPLTLEDPIGGARVQVREAAAPALPWIVGDVVAAQGIVRKGLFDDARLRIQCVGR